MSLSVSPGFFFAAVCSDCGWPPFYVKKTGWQFDGWHLPLCGGEYGGGDYRWGTGDPIEIRIQASSFPWSCATNLKRSGLLLMSMDGRMSGSWLTASINRKAIHLTYSEAPWGVSWSADLWQEWCDERHWDKVFESIGSFERYGWARKYRAGNRTR